MKLNNGLELGTVIRMYSQSSGKDWQSTFEGQGLELEPLNPTHGNPESVSVQGDHLKCCEADHAHAFSWHSPFFSVFSMRRRRKTNRPSSFKSSVTRIAVRFTIQSLGRKGGASNIHLGQ